MKNVTQQLSLLFLLIFCNTAVVNAGSVSQDDQTSQSGIKGNWEITDVSFPGSGYINVISFQIAESRCLVGSTWNFISSNNKGTVKLNASGCPAFKSDIVWSINKDGEFVLKIVDAGVKAKDINQGFVLKLSELSAESFKLTDVIDVAGQKKEIVYTFEKVFEFQ